jgi:hypothetical protein
MSFLVLILVSAIVINLSYIVLNRLTKYLSKKIPNICESLILRFKNRLTTTTHEDESLPSSSSHEYNPFNEAYQPVITTEERPIKTLKRRNKWRHHLCTCLDSLDNGHGSPFVQSLWKGYQRYIPQWARYVNTEAGIEDPLPAWMESSIVAYQSVYLWRVVQFLLLFYVFLILASHLWLPYTLPFLFSADVAVSSTTSASLYAILGINVSRCDENDDDDDHGTYCFLSDEPPSAPKLRNQALRYFSNLGAYNQSRHPSGDFIFDSQYQPLAAFNLLEIPHSVKIPISLWTFGIGEEEEEEKNEDHLLPVMTRRYVHMKESMLSLVSALYHEESQYVCVCAPFLNIIDNVTFYRDGSEWQTLFEPVIVRNNTFSDLVLTRIKYSETSRFYQKDALFKQIVPHLEEERVHHDSFVIEYSESSDAPLEVIQNLVEMTEKLNLFYRTHDDAQKGVMLFARQVEKAQRKRVHLTGNDAICFVYCNALNEALLNHD